MDFSKAGEMMKMQQKAIKIQKELKNTLIEAEFDGLVITFNWEMKVEKVEFEDISIIWDKEKLEKAILEAANKGLKKSQELSSAKMQGVMKSMWMNLSGI